MIQLVISILVSSISIVHAQSAQPTVKSISIYRNEIQLDAKKNPEVRIGTKFSAKLPVPHKCLLVVTRVVKKVVYADATQCPGYATLRKGQSVEISIDHEMNEEVRQAPAENKEKS